MKEAKERELAKAIREPLGEEAVEQTVAIQQTSETTGAPQAEQHSPYERFDRKELGQITDNVIGSLVDGIRKYDPAEVERTLRNLLNIQRELERRFDEYKPAHERNTREKAVLYVTQLSPRIINRIYAKLEGIDGGFSILSRIKASYPEMPIGESGSVDDVTLENTEIRGAMYDITKKRREELQKSDSSNFYGIDKPINPYSTKTNEELGELVQRFKQSIAQERAKGKEPTALIDNLMLIGKVIKYRES